MFTKQDQLRKHKRRKKATNDSGNKYFKWLRNYRPECVVCGDYGEIHHIDFGYKRDDKRVVMLCTKHHSAQSMDGLHHDTKSWYKRFKTFEELEEIAERNFDSFILTGGTM